MRNVTGPAHRDPNVLRWLLAYALSCVANSAYFLALGWTAKEIAGPAQVGWVVAAGAAPRVLLMLVGGASADRFGPRLVVIVSDTVRCVMILTFAAGLVLTSPTLWLLLAVAILYGVVDAFFMPSVGALPALITGPDQLVRLQGMRGVTLRLGTVTGPPLAGLAMGLGGSAAVFGAVGVLLALSLLLLVFVRTLPVRGGDEEGGYSRGELWRDLMEGFAYARSRRLVGAVLVSIALVEIATVGPLNVGFLLLADDRRWGVSGAGWIIGGFGAGAGASGLLLTWWANLPRPGAVYCGTMIAGSLGIGCFAWVGTLPVAVVASAVTGGLLGLNGALALAFVQTATEPAMLGRIMSLGTLVGFGVAPFTIPVFGTTAAAIGTPSVFLICSALGLVGSGIVLTSSAIRRAELTPSRCDDTRADIVT
ncbi:MFS transporter [Streptomyces rubellomurinus]|uniref:MFS transporter n=1 Tax=Streptomyces rubellomurinus (strain ATCC 31215) TaxID=359131 RepID=UPI0005F1BDD6|nr:MFS transporter [Streptomyces rubellomurinus]